MRVKTPGAISIGIGAFAGTDDWAKAGELETAAADPNAAVPKSRSRRERTPLATEPLGRGSELSIVIFPRIVGRDRFESVPMLGNLAVGDPIQVIDCSRLSAKLAFVYDQYKVTLAQDHMHAVILDREALFRQRL